jgi:hypothetical protein
MLRKPRRLGDTRPLAGAGAAGAAARLAYALRMVSVYTGMDVEAEAALQALVAAIPFEKLRFLTAERRRAYAAILWTLLGHRRSHEIEVYYDDLMIEAIVVVPGVEPGIYTPDGFRGDVRQLEEWGNLAPRRLEPRRIETLADRSLQKFLCRLDDDTAAVLEFLEGRSRAAVAALSDRGRHLLRDADERLGEALRLARQQLREAAPPAREPVSPVREEVPAPDREPAAAAAPASDDLLRLSYLVFEADRKVDDAARELAAFDAALVGFAVSPFQLQALAEVVDRLERYVEDYIAEATVRARALHRTARKLLRPALAAVLSRSRAEVERRMRDDPLLGGAAGPPRDLGRALAELVPFFAPMGRFETLLERVHASARKVVRRVHKHVENVRARNIRIETLRDRSREMARLDAGDLEQANAWINRLFASAHVVTDFRSGTPEARSPLPRPARRYESRRAAHTGEPLAAKQGRPGQSRALERLRLLHLGRFVEEKILRGAARAPLHGAALDGVDDFRSLLEAVKVHDLRAGRARKLLSYRVVRLEAGGAPAGRACFSLAGGNLDAPDLVFVHAGSAAPAAGGARDPRYVRDSSDARDAAAG